MGWNTSGSFVPDGSADDVSMKMMGVGGDIDPDYQGGDPNKQQVGVGGASRKQTRMRPPVNPKSVVGTGHKFGQVVQGEGIHKGTDLQATAGTPVQAPVDGTAHVASERALGLQVHDVGAGGLDHRMSHLQSANVQNGQHVKAGQIIGRVGSSGTGSTGPHLDYRVQDARGNYLNTDQMLGPLARMPMSPNTVGAGGDGGNPTHLIIVIPRSGFQVPKVGTGGDGPVGVGDDAYGSPGVGAQWINGQWVMPGQPGNNMITNPDGTLYSGAAPIVNPHGRAEYFNPTQQQLEDQYNLGLMNLGIQAGNMLGMYNGTPTLDYQQLAGKFFNGPDSGQLTLPAQQATGYIFGTPTTEQEQISGQLGNGNPTLAAQEALGSINGSPTLAAGALALQQQQNQNQTALDTLKLLQSAQSDPFVFERVARGVTQTGLPGSVAALYSNAPVSKFQAPTMQPQGPGLSSLFGSIGIGSPNMFMPSSPLTTSQSNSGQGQGQAANQQNALFGTSNGGSGTGHGTTTTGAPNLPQGPAENAGINADATVAAIRGTPITQFNAPNFFRETTPEQQFTLSAMNEAGYNPQYVTDTFQNMMPQFKAPTMSGAINQAGARGL